MIKASLKGSHDEWWRLIRSGLWQPQGWGLLAFVGKEIETRASVFGEENNREEGAQGLGGLFRHTILIKGMINSLPFYCICVAEVLFLIKRSKASCLYLNFLKLWGTYPPHLTRPSDPDYDACTLTFIYFFLIIEIIATYFSRAL